MSNDIHKCDPLREWNNKHYPYVDIEIHNNGYLVYSADSYFDIEINYCPFCGAKL